MRVAWIRPALVVVGTTMMVAACGSAADTVTTTTATPATATTGPPVTATSEAPVVTTTPDTEPSVCLSGDLAFRQSGVIADLGAEPGDAAQIAAIRWAAHPGCERVVVDLLTSTGAPASAVGDATVEMDAARGIVRVALAPDVTETGIADTLIESELTTRAYVVRRPDRGLSVDIHLGASVPVEARAFVVDAPARIVVDLRPAPAGGTAVVTPPVAGDRVVVLDPAGPDETYPITISGYARTFEATVVARVLVDGQPAVEASTTATDWLDAWGTFSITIPTGPTGSIELFVGEDSARDGTPQGVLVPLEIP